MVFRTYAQLPREDSTLDIPEVDQLITLEARKELEADVERATPQRDRAQPTPRTRHAALATALGGLRSPDYVT